MIGFVSDVGTSKSKAADIPGGKGLTNIIY